MQKNKTGGQAMNRKGQGLILALIFLLGAVSLGGLAYWGFVAQNALAIVIGVVGVIAWFFAGRFIL